MWTSVWSVMTTALAQTGEAATETTGQVNPFSQMLPMFILFIGIMYFLMIRPNQKREKQRREMLASLSKGDQVVTNGGVCGTVVGLSEKIGRFARKRRPAR